MAQSGFTPIKLYSSTTPAATPTAGNLEQGELAINTNDGKLFYEDSSGVVKVIASQAGAFGDVVGPASATDNAVARYDGATGKLIQNSSVTIDDSNNVSGVVQLNATTVDTTNIEVTNLKAKDGTSAGSIADSTGIVTLASSVLTTTDINGGTIDNATIGATTPSTVVATQVDITAQGDLRLQDTTGGQYVALQAPGTIATSYTLTLPVDDGTAGQALITDGSGALSWSSAASGDVYGPASATDNAVARFDGTTGKIIQNSTVTIADTTGNMTGVGTLGVGAITTTGALTYGGVTLNNAVTGTGNMVLSTSPTLVTPALGTPTALVGTNITGTAAGLTAGNVTTNANLTGAITSTGNATVLGSFSSANLAGALTDETGTGSAVFANSPTLVTPALGTPASGVVTNLTGTASININGTVGATTPNTGNFTVLTENGSPVVVQTDIGTAPNEIPLNQYLGNLAFQDAANIAGNVGVGGNLVIGTAGKGIDFSANSSAAGMTSELLDDYEEGTWTPTIAFNGASVGVTYFAQTGTYTKIGNAVIVTGNLYIDSNGSSTGSLEIKGFPFAANSYSSISLSIRGGMTYTGTVLAYINVAEARASVEQTSEVAVMTPITQANLFNPQIFFTCAYTTNA